ncbi:MAG: copper-translocating P-type ATPase [Bacilli bacterium]|nr:copper-translocating P-type ATPase [Bacilli bacterium]
MKKIILKIEGMSCSACSNGLEKYLKKQKGIEDASVNLVMATASITYEDSLTILDLENFVEEAGFKSLGEEKLLEKKEEEKKTPYIILGILGLFIMLLTMQHMIKIPIPSFLDMKKSPISYSIILFVLTIPYMIYSIDILKNGVKNAIHRMPNMDTLVSLGIVSSYLYSVVGVILILCGQKEQAHHLYFESTIFVIYFIKLGRYLNHRSKNKTKEAIQELVKITPSKAHIKSDDSYLDITIDEVKKGDILICLPGERVAVDGEIVKGSSTFDEAFITGESVPQVKTKGSKVIAGSINYDNPIEYEAERIGRDSTISEIVHLVVEATNTKAPISKIADKICSYFVPGVLIIAFVTFVLYWIITKNLGDSLTHFVTVLVVACPCALGLATPLALVVSVGNSAKKGILIKDSESLEQASKVDTIVFDKTGTLTYGTLSISEIHNHSSLEEKEILEILASLEKYSSHPISVGINRYAKEARLDANLDLMIEELPGYGIKGKDDRNVYYACNGALLKKLDIINSYEDEEHKMTENGNTVIYLVKNKKVMATFGLRDVIRKESISLIKKLRDKKIEVIMLSGDNEKTAKKIGNELAIEEVVAGVTPKEKTEYMKKLMAEGKKVMMVGDGINDAPSLTSATVGVSLSSGTDIATNAANIVLVSSNLMKIDELMTISSHTMKNIKQNLFWAFIYNIIMIPIAIGIIPKIPMNPMIACMAMILSSLTVTLNALRLRRMK